MLVNHGPSQKSSKKNTSHGNEVLPHDTTHLIQRPCGQRENLYQDPAGKRTTWKPPDHRKERRRPEWYGHVSRSSGLAKTILQGTVKGGRRQGRQRKRWEDNNRKWTGLWFGKSQRAVENREKMEKTGCKIIYGAPTTLAVKGLMMMMMISAKLYIMRAA